MASIARGLSRRTNPYETPCNHIITIALQSFILRTFSYNALSFHDHDPHHAFKPLNPPKTLKPRKNSQLKSPNEEIKKTADDNTDDQPLWSLDRKDKTPIHSPLPFDFKYSYSESNPNLTPIGFREKKFSPFGPGRIDRKWTGWYAAAPQQAKRNADTFRKHREEVLGDPLTEEEIAELVEKYGRSNCDRQINLGRGGVTHNMLDDIHNHWKRGEAIRIKCLGVPTIDMDNICFHLEDKTGGKIISRRTNILILYRGRHYDPKQRPVIPLMLWKPHEPIYPRLIKDVVDGLTSEETKEMRKRGLSTPPLTRLTKNGVYHRLVQKVRDAFTQNELVRIDCKGMETSDYKKIGSKLRDLVPCVLLLFKDEQIVIWRGKNYHTTKASSEPVSDVVTEGSNNSLLLLEAAHDADNNSVVT